MSRNCRRGPHTVYELHYYHFVFTTKYRKPWLRGDIGVAVRDLIRGIREKNDIRCAGINRQIVEDERALHRKE